MRTNPVASIDNSRKIRSSGLLRVDDDCVFIAFQHRCYHRRPIRDLREASRPYDSNRPSAMHLQEGQAWSDSRASGNHDNRLEEQRDVNDSEGWQAFHPELVRSLRIVDELLGPVAGIRDDYRVAPGAVRVRDHGEGVSLRQRRIRYPDRGSYRDLARSVNAMLAATYQETPTFR